jgi:hypothetical protein
MKRPPDDETLEAIFREQVKIYDQLKYDLEIYYRTPAGDPNHSYEYLLNAAKHWLQRQREDKNKKAVQNI